MNYTPIRCYTVFNWKAHTEGSILFIYSPLSACISALRKFRPSGSSLNKPPHTGSTLHAGKLTCAHLQNKRRKRRTLLLLRQTISTVTSSGAPRPAPVSGRQRVVSPGYGGEGRAAPPADRVQGGGSKGLTFSLHITQSTSHNMICLYKFPCAFVSWLLGWF